MASWSGAWAERHLIGLQLEAAGDEGLLDPPDIDGAPGALRVAVVRAFALLPVVAVFIVAWQPLYDAAYHELVLPDELATPLGLRVLGDVPWVVAGRAGRLGPRGRRRGTRRAAPRASAGARSSSRGCWAGSTSSGGPFASSRSRSSGSSC